jgi:hypothetical protein
MERAADSEYTVIVNAPFNQQYIRLTRILQGKPKRWKMRIAKEDQRVAYLLTPVNVWENPPHHHIAHLARPLHTVAALGLHGERLHDPQRYRRPQ